MMRKPSIAEGFRISSGCDPKRCLPRRQPVSSSRSRAWRTNAATARRSVRGVFVKVRRARSGLAIAGKVCQCERVTGGTDVLAGYRFDIAACCRAVCALAVFMLLVTRCCSVPVGLDAPFTGVFAFVSNPAFDFAFMCSLLCTGTAPVYVDVLFCCAFAWAVSIVRNASAISDTRCIDASFTRANSSDNYRMSSMETCCR